MSVVLTTQFVWAYKSFKKIPSIAVVTKHEATTSKSRRFLEANRTAVDLFGNVSDESPSGDSSGNVYGVIQCCCKTCFMHLTLRKIQIKLACPPILRSKEKFQRLVFRTLTCSAHFTVRRKTPAPPVASHSTKPASSTYGLPGLND